MKPTVKPFFDKNTNTISYVVSDPATNTCAIIDSVADYEPNSATLTYASADMILNYIQKHNLRVVWILETHMHADHITAASYLKEKTGAPIAMGIGIETVYDTFAPVFFPEKPKDLSDFDRLFSDGEKFTIGSLEAQAIHVPGHTPADMAYQIGDAVFAGDTIFMPDFGSARCDFPGGSAELLHASVQKLYTLPDETRLFMCHDYLPEGRTDHLFETTIDEEKKSNIHLKQKISAEDFILIRTERDKKLPVPRLIIPSLQANLHAGKLTKHNEKDVIIYPVNDIFSTV